MLYKCKNIRTDLNQTHLLNDVYTSQQFIYLGITSRFGSDFEQSLCHNAAKQTNKPVSNPIFFLN